MSKVFKPYLKAGIGSNPAKKYTIGNGRLDIADAFRGSSGIDLPPTSHEVKQTLVQKAADIGDVIVKRQGTSVECTKVSGVKAFVAALYDSDETAEQQNVKTAWSEGMSEKDLADFAYLIPRMPQTLINVRDRINLMGTASHGWEYGLINKWHKEGETLCELHGNYPVAPYDGKFLGAYTAYEYPETEKLNALLAEDQELLCIFQPLTGAPKDVNWSEVYIEQTKTMALASGERRVPSSLKHITDLRSRVSSVLENFSETKLIALSISDIPKPHPDLGPNDFAP